MRRESLVETPFRSSPFRSEHSDGRTSPDCRCVSTSLRFTSLRPSSLPKAVFGRGSSDVTLRTAPLHVATATTSTLFFGYRPHPPDTAKSLRSVALRSFVGYRPHPPDTAKSLRSVALR